MATRNVLLATAGAAALGLAVSSTADAQQFAQATTDLNLRAGPGMEHMVIGTMPAGAQLEVHQCIAGRVWCEVTFAGTTGWASQHFLTTEVALAPRPDPGAEIEVAAEPLVEPEVQYIERSQVLFMERQPARPDPATEIELAAEPLVEELVEPEVQYIERGQVLFMERQPARPDPATEIELAAEPLPEERFIERAQVGVPVRALY